MDKPKSGGSGTSNDGNTARRFFLNSEISAEITGIKKDLLDRCWTILQCLNSGYNINKTKFEEFALETARQLVAEYPWYNMPASVHKVLVHGANVIDHALLSIGELSEEAAEATNKHIKSFRRNHTRKMSRILTNTDLVNRLLLHSDPLISSLRKLNVKKSTVKMCIRFVMYLKLILLLRLLYTGIVIINYTNVELIFISLVRIRIFIEKMEIKIPK